MLFLSTRALKTHKNVRQQKPLKILSSLSYTIKTQLSNNKKPIKKTPPKNNSCKLRQNFFGHPWSRLSAWAKSSGTTYYARLVSRHDGNQGVNYCPFNAGPPCVLVSLTILWDPDEADGIRVAKNNQGANDLCARLVQSARGGEMPSSRKLSI